MSTNTNIDDIRESILKLEGSFDFRSRVESDPVKFVHRFKRTEDKEIAGLIASCLAYGKVEIILRHLEEIFALLGDSPEDFIKNWNPEKEIILEGFCHRFNNADDVRTLIWAIKKIKEKYNRLEDLFIESYLPEKGLKGLENGLEHFSDTFIKTGKDSPFKGTRSFEYFFPKPSKGSTCKRLCLYLRWMCREDEVDPGGWTKVDKADLVSPVDAHMSRIGKYLGFTKRSNTSWKMSLDITEAFKKIDSADPLKYEFLICHLGMSGICPNKQNKNKCDLCTLKGICSRAY